MRGRDLGNDLQDKILLDDNDEARFDVYDIRKKADLNTTYLANFMNSAQVQAELGVTGRRWTECNDTVYDRLNFRDEIIDCAPQLVPLLEGGI